MFSYHNHSVFSDGSAAPEQMIVAGVRAGLTETGMSDHYSVLPGGSFPGWSMTDSSLGEYFSCLDALKEKYSGETIVRKGVEIDFFPETIDAVCGSLEPFSPDYIIGSVHFWGDFPIDDTAEKWTALSPEEADCVIEGYWKKIIAMAEDGRVDIVGHIDLYKKFGRFGRIDTGAFEDTALEAVRDSGLALEINTAGFYKPAGEFYPSLSVLRKDVRLEIPVVVNSDAHHPAHLRRSFPEAYKLLEGLGVSRLAGYEGRRMVMRGLDY